jgi:hypothetical protein
MTSTTEVGPNSGRMRGTAVLTLSLRIGYTPRFVASSRPAKSSSRASRGPSNPSVDLVLYISGNSRYTLVAQRNCEELLSRFDRRRVSLEVCDVSRHPERAEADAVCYTPMLVKRHPLPRACVLGDLSNSDVLVGLLESCGLGLRR